MFSTGSVIRDRAGNHWIVTQTWRYGDYLCVTLMGADNSKLAGQMGGARFRSGDEILVKL